MGQRPPLLPTLGVSCHWLLVIAAADVTALRAGVAVTGRVHVEAVKSLELAVCMVCDMSNAAVPPSEI